MGKQLKKIRKFYLKELRAMHDYFHHLFDHGNRYFRVAGAALLLLGGMKLAFMMISGTTRPTNNEDMARVSVKITNAAENSGGSGVILKSTQNGSFILTNGHVCGVVEQGGVVITDDGNRHAVGSYRLSEQDDLCLLKVSANLRVNTAVAQNAPGLYSAASISGHPRLMPNIVTRGHFSGHMMIDIMVGMRECTPEEQNSDLAIVCALLGGMPVIRRYESQAVSATIEPGSSGSPVFDSNGEIAALVFAGAGTLGYALAVPQEAIAGFLNSDVSGSKTLYPNNTRSLKLEQAKVKLRVACAKASEEKDAKAVKTYCRFLEGDMIWKPQN